MLAIFQITRFQLWSGLLTKQMLAFFPAGDIVWFRVVVYYAIGKRWLVLSSSAVIS